MTHPVLQNCRLAERTDPDDNFIWTAQKEILDLYALPGKNSPSLSTGVPLLRDRLAFLLGGAKDDMILKWETIILV